MMINIDILAGRYPLLPSRIKCYPADMAQYQHILARRCWIFDLDGTLTLPVHDFAAIRKSLGMSESDPDILTFLASLTAPEAGAMRTRLMEIEYELAARTAAAPGAGQLLDRLLRRGARVGILTRNTREIALHTLGLIGLGGYFSPDTILGRDEAEPKPHPAGIAKLLATWGGLPEEAVMVGDYLYDLQVGRAAGTATIHVDRSGTFPWPELADLAVATLEELAEELTETGIRAPLQPPTP
jgi:HAD superfamily hydrolase (TIGR01509 family)